MEDTLDASTVEGETRLLFDHATAQAAFGASVFWLRRLAAWEGEATAIEYWQVKRGGDRRGLHAVNLLEVREYLSLHPAERAAST